MKTDSITFRWLGKQDYMSSWQRMQDFTRQRNDNTSDEIWFLEHPPVFTQGQNGKAEHLLMPGDIPVIKTDRGGQITFHGPGQLMVYTLIDLKRKKFTVRDIVSKLEQAVIDLLASHNISAYGNRCAPGVYVNEQKICSIGLRVRKFCVYHGLAFNIHMDLEPFSRINPCGFTNLKMTQLAHWLPTIDVKTAAHNLVNYLKKNLVYTHHTCEDHIANIENNQHAHKQTARC